MRDKERTPTCKRFSSAAIGLFVASALALGVQLVISFVRKWLLRCETVVNSFEEADDELFTFLQFPPLQWKAMRTTNALERINQEFRRRTKTQASLPGEDGGLLLLYGLLRGGQIVLRRIDGRNPRFSTS